MHSECVDGPATLPQLLEVGGEECVVRAQDPRGRAGRHDDRAAVPRLDRPVGPRGHPGHQRRAAVPERRSEIGLVPHLVRGDPALVPRGERRSEVREVGEVSRRGGHARPEQPWLGVPRGPGGRRPDHVGDVPDPVGPGGGDEAVELAEVIDPAPRLNLAPRGPGVPEPKRADRDGGQDPTAGVDPDGGCGHPAVGRQPRPARCPLRRRRRERGRDRGRGRRHGTGICRRSLGRARGTARADDEGQRRGAREQPVRTMRRQPHSPTPSREGSA